MYFRAHGKNLASLGLTFMKFLTLCILVSIGSMSSANCKCKRSYHKFANL